MLRIQIHIQETDSQIRYLYLDIYLLKRSLSSISSEDCECFRDQHDNFSVAIIKKLHIFTVLTFKKKLDPDPGRKPKKPDPERQGKKLRIRSH